MYLLPHSGKIIAKKKMVETPKLKELVQSEILVLKKCRSENVIKYIDSFSSEKEVFIFTEFCNGGDMEAYLSKKKRLKEDEAREFLKQILNGFLGLHEIGAMHRDFKTANILLHNGVAKIADLGFTKILKDKVITTTILGTSVTMAPELLENQSYGAECDIWSVGVVYYQFLIGEYPYNAMNDHEILKKIKKYPPRFPETVEISEMSKDFVRKCLTIDPKKRISWAEIYEHPLFDQKKNNQRTTNIGALMSQIDLNKNKGFYKNRGLAVHVEPQTAAEDFKKAELAKNEEILKIQQEMKRREAVESALLSYSEYYIQKRNLIMLTIKYGISLIFELQDLPFNQNLYAFLIAKRAYLEMRDLKSNIKERRNPFEIKQYLEEFFQSKEYREIYRLVSTDHEFIAVYAESFMLEVRTENENVKRELSLDVVTPKFNPIYKEELNSYAFQLYDHKDNPRVKKATCLRLMTFVSDLVKGIMCSPEQYEKRMETLDVRQMEDDFAKKIQDLYSSYGN